MVLGTEEALHKCLPNVLEVNECKYVTMGRMAKRLGAEAQGRTALVCSWQYHSGKSFYLFVPGFLPCKVEMVMRPVSWCFCVNSVNY